MDTTDENFNEINDKIQSLADKNDIDQTRLIVTISWSGSIIYQSFVEASTLIIFSSVLFSVAILCEFLSCLLYKKYADYAYDVINKRSKTAAEHAIKAIKIASISKTLRDCAFGFAMLSFTIGLIMNAL